MGMFKIEKVVEIQAPAEIVWEVITDFSRYPDWNPFCIACDTTMKPGDPIRMKVQLMPIPQNVEEVVDELVPGKRFAYHMKPAPLGALTSKRSHDVESLGAERTRYRSYFHLAGWVMPLVRGLLGGRLQIGFAGMTAGIQKRAEALWAQRRGGIR